MTFLFRALLVLAAMFSLYFVIHHLRKNQLLVKDSLFWLLFAVLMVVLAVFPQIAFWAARILGIQSPSNLVYLVVIAILLYRQFRITLRLSLLDTKLKVLTQNLALKEESGEIRSEK